MAKNLSLCKEAGTPLFDEQQVAKDHSDAMGSLSSLVETYGIARILTELAKICQSKSDSMQNGWPDAKMGRNWKQWADAINNVWKSVN